MIGKVILFMAAGLVVFAVLTLAVAWIVAFLWNFLVPLFGLPLLSIWHALALVLLVSFLKGNIKVKVKK